MTPKLYIKMTHVKKRLDYVSKYKNHSILDSQHNWEEGEGSIWPLNEHANLHFDNECNSHTVNSM